MQLVEHRIYGKGKIQKQRFGGFELYIEFEDGIRRWVRRDEVRFLSETSILKKSEPSKPILLKDEFEAREIIEALRLGIAPCKYIEKLTFGREKEINQINYLLNNSNDGSFVIIGEYGVGKTHLLEYIYFSALNNNWAVSIVELDPNEAPFHKPKVIYQKIISSFRFKNQNGNFREFLKKIASSTSRDELKEHKYLGKIVEKIRDETDDEEIWRWIEGESPPPFYEFPKMFSYSTTANIYCYILSGIGWATKNILGLNGFLILFDEAEIVDSYWYTSYQNNKAWNFLTGLILMASNDKRLLKENIELRWLGYSQGHFGKETNLQYCGHSQIPFIWKIPCYVKIIFAFAPIQQVLDKEPLNNLHKIEMEHLHNEILKLISKEIAKLYQKAYNFQLNRDFFDLLPKDKTRLFIKGMIEALDLIRFHPNKSLEELLK